LLSCRNFTNRRTVQAELLEAEKVMLATMPQTEKKMVKVGGALEFVRPIRNWIICGAGFGQNEGQWDQGIPALCRLLHEKHAGPELRVEFMRWDEDWAAKADWIFGAAAGAIARILTINYSWSVGNGYRNLARQLQMRGQWIEHAIFADGVYHWGGNWMHKIGAAQLLACVPRPWGRPEIPIPRSVGTVDWFVQSPKSFRWGDYNTWLRGHRIVWDDDHGDVPGRVDVDNVLHHWMDDGEQFQQHAIEVAEEMFGDRSST
jgi:hypothetical protein